MGFPSAPDAVTAAVRVTVGLAACATLMGLWGRAGWLCELACHFRLQYAWLLLGGITFFLVTGHLPEAALSVPFTLVNLALIAPVYVGGAPWTHRPLGPVRDPSAGIPQPRVEERGEILSGGRRPMSHFESKSRARRIPRGTVRAFSANVQWSNRSFDRLHRVIRDVDPDLIMLVEVTTEWLAALSKLRAGYPFSKSVLGQGGFGATLHSRLPFERAEVAYLGTVKLPAVVARVRLDDRRFTVIGTQPVSPTTPHRMRRRNRQLAALAEFAALQGRPLMILGDLNTTSWSPVFQDFLRAAQLRDSRVGFGLQPTWPAVAAPLRIPIDHCVVSEDIVVQQRRVGPRIGSDHLPVVVEFSIG